MQSLREQFIRLRRGRRRGITSDQNQRKADDLLRPKTDNLQNNPSQSSTTSQQSEPTGNQTTSSHFDKLYGPSGNESARVQLSFRNDKNFLKRDITVLKCDAIINFVYNDDIYGRLNIVENAGHVVKHEYDCKRPPFTGYGLTKTAAGKYQYIKAIYHVEVLEESPEFVKDAIYRVLSEADKEGMGYTGASEIKCTLLNKAYVESYHQIDEAFQRVKTKKNHNDKEDQEYQNAEAGMTQIYSLSIKKYFFILFRFMRLLLISNFTF